MTHFGYYSRMWLIPRKILLLCIALTWQPKVSRMTVPGVRCRVRTSLHCVASVWFCSCVIVTMDPIHGLRTLNKVFQLYQQIFSPYYVAPLIWPGVDKKLGPIKGRGGGVTWSIRFGLALFIHKWNNFFISQISVCSWSSWFACKWLPHGPRQV